MAVRARFIRCCGKRHTSCSRNTRTREWSRVQSSHKYCAHCNQHAAYPSRERTTRALFGETRQAAPTCIQRNKPPATSQLSQTIGSEVAATSWSCLKMAKLFGSVCISAHDAVRKLVFCRGRAKEDGETAQAAPSAVHSVTSWHTVHRNSPSRVAATYERDSQSDSVETFRLHQTHLKT